jgi:hypothetical protein
MRSLVALFGRKSDMYAADAGGRKDVQGHGSTKGRQGLMHPGNRLVSEYAAQLRPARELK